MKCVGLASSRPLSSISRIGHVAATKRSPISEEITQTRPTCKQEAGVQRRMTFDHRSFFTNVGFVTLILLHTVFEVMPIDPGMVVFMLFCFDTLFGG